MLKLYRKSQEVQYRWIRKHPIQWVALNVALTVVFVGYLEYKDRKEMRAIENEIAPQQEA